MQREEYPYECQCKGHEGDRTFTAAPPGWWAEKNLNTPRSCPDCRAWIKAQVDSKRSCDCGRLISLPKNLKISIHMKEGPYKDPEQCMYCENGHKPPKTNAERPKRPEKKRRERSFNDLLHGMSVESRRVLVDHSYYSSISDRRTGEKRYEHIEKHITGAPGDRTSEDGTTSSTFATNGSFDQTMAVLAVHMLDASQSSIREYPWGASSIVRVTYFGSDDHLELTFLKKLSQPENAYVVITTYDNTTVDDVAKNEWYTGGNHAER